MIRGRLAQVGSAMSQAVVRLLSALALGVLIVASPQGGAAGVQRTFVASGGSDANPCSLAMPCRSFAAALAQTTSNGEIIVLDSAGYGTFLIDRAVSIVAPAGIYAGVTAPAGNGIIVNAPGAIVVLRGLEINGMGTSGGSGILHLAAASLLIDRCTVSGFANGGGVLAVAEGGIVLFAGPATVADTVVKNNLRSGIAVQGADASNPVRVSIVGTRMEGNGIAVASEFDAGLAVVAGAMVTVKDSVVAGNFRGFSVCGAGASEPLGAVLSIDHSLADRNIVGLFAGQSGSSCAARVSNSTVTNNLLFGIEQQGTSVVASLGNNFVYSNVGGETFGQTIGTK